MDDAQPTPVSRRRMLKRIGAGAAVAWSAPILTSMRVPAFAQYGGNCDPAKQFCGPPDPRCGVPGVACPLPNGCAVGACTLQLDNSCLCWDFAVCTSADSLRSQQPGALAFSLLNRIARLFKPVAAQVSEARHAVFIDTPKLLLIMPAKFHP